MVRARVGRCQSSICELSTTEIEIHTVLLCTCGLSAPMLASRVCPLHSEDSARSSLRVEHPPCGVTLEPDGCSSPRFEAHLTFPSRHGGLAGLVFCRPVKRDTRGVVAWTPRRSRSSEGPLQHQPRWQCFGGGNFWPPFGPGRGSLNARDRSCAT